MRLDVKLHSPYLVVPQGGYLSPESSLLVVDLGTLSIAGNTKGQLKDQCPLPQGPVSGEIEAERRKREIEEKGGEMIVFFLLLSRMVTNWHVTMTTSLSSCRVCKFWWQNQVRIALLVSMVIGGTYPLIRGRLAAGQVSREVFPPHPQPNWSAAAAEAEHCQEGCLPPKVSISLYIALLWALPSPK